MKYRVRSTEGELEYSSFGEVEKAWNMGLIEPNDEVLARADHLDAGRGALGAEGPRPADGRLPPGPPSPASSSGRRSPPRWQR